MEKKNIFAVSDKSGLSLRIFCMIILPVLLFSCNPERTGGRNTGDKKDSVFIENVLFKAGNNYLKYWNGERYSELFINAMNIGVGVPGTFPGEVAPTEAQYKRWLHKISDLGMNSIRIYTLLKPDFYKAVSEYNNENKDKPLYIFHGIWLDYHEGEGLTDYTDEFKQEIREVTDAVYGNIEIPERTGKAYGKYEYDISDWVIGWILGREIEPEEIKMTNQKSSEREYTGEYFYIKDVNPSTVWVTEKLDYIVKYESEYYKKERPVSFSSWPTLDPVKHISEREDSTEDKEELELYKIKKSKSNAGYFASYHAYPYYPDFMNNNLKYHSYKDEYGKNPYIGYLKELKSFYKDIPLIIAEYGVPSSWGNAKQSVSGMSHGGHSEEMQGIYAVRMLKNMYDTNCGGGGYFALFDEWWKNCWINEPSTFPRESYHLWHDVTNPEQNYGLMTFKPQVLIKERADFLEGETSEYTESVYFTVDPQFFHIDINLKLFFNGKLYVLIDTYGDIKGENEGERNIKVSDETGIEVIRGGEFLLEIDIENRDAELYVAKNYDLFGIWFDLNTRGWNPGKSESGGWNPVMWKNNDRYLTGDGRIIEEQVQHIGRLKVRLNDQNESNLDAVVLDDWRRVNIRLPWNLLQFSNPSSREVFWGNKEMLETGSRESDGIGVSLVFYRKSDNEILDKVETEKVKWEKWDLVRLYSERDKKSYDIFRRKFKELEKIIHGSLN